MVIWLQTTRTGMQASIRKRVQKSLISGSVQRKIRNQKTQLFRLFWKTSAASGILASQSSSVLSDIGEMDIPAYFRYASTSSKTVSAAFTIEGHFRPGPSLPSTIFLAYSFSGAYLSALAYAAKAAWFLLSIFCTSSTTEPDFAYPVQYAPAHRYCQARSRSSLSLATPARHTYVKATIADPPYIFPA